MTGPLVSSVYDLKVGEHKLLEEFFNLFRPEMKTLLEQMIDMCRWECVDLRRWRVPTFSLLVIQADNILARGGYFTVSPSDLEAWRYRLLGLDHGC